MIVIREDIIKTAKNVIDIEKEAIAKIRNRIDNNFIDIIELILSSKGRLIIAGVGKSANIANKIVATFNSTGQPAVFLHAADAIHGDLGNVQSEDVVICISKSGDTKEIKQIIPIIKSMGNKIIALTGNSKSYLARKSDFFLDSSVEKEACPYNLAPTSSTTVQLVIGDALAVCLLSCKDFTEEDFARFHPGGMLGKRLNVKVQDLISDYTPKVNLNTSINDVIIEISQNRLGTTAVFDNKELVGIITDGDLRRMLENKKDITSTYAKDIMSCNPKTIKQEVLAYDALKKMERYNITQLIVMKNKQYLGIIHIHDIMKEGIISK